MVGTAGKLLMATALVALATGQVAWAQDMPPASQLPTPRLLPPAPAPAEANPPATWPPLPGAWPPADYRLPPVDDSEQPPTADDPLLNLRQLPPPGWYSYVETGFIDPHIKDRIFGTVAVTPARRDTVHVPQANLSWTVSPRIELGYRLPHGFGEFLTNYRFLQTQGSQDTTGELGTAHLNSHLTLQVLDFDYANRHILTPLWGLEMRWKAGVEVTAAFFDSSATGLNPAAAAGTGPVSQFVSNNLVGAGPHAGVELWHHLPVRGLALYGQFEGSSLYGHQVQVLQETLGPGAGGPLTAASRLRTSQGVGVLGGQLGLSWTPPTARFTRFLTGYQFRWWEQLGRTPGSASDAELLEQGFFLRGEFSF